MPKLAASTAERVIELRPFYDKRDLLQRVNDAVNPGSRIGEARATRLHVGPRRVNGQVPTVVALVRPRYATHEAIAAARAVAPHACILRWDQHCKCDKCLRDRRCVQCNAVIGTRVMVALGRRPSNMQVCENVTCQSKQQHLERAAECETLHGATWTDPSKRFYDDCAICNPPRVEKRGRPAKHLAYPEPPEAVDYKGDDVGYDKAKRKFHADCMALEGGSEAYSDGAYRNAQKRAKRPRDSDNEKRRARASYNPIAGSR